MPPAVPASLDTPKQTWLQWLWEEERIGIPLCIGIAAFLSLAFGGSFLHNLVYSFCIGQTIQFSIEAGRHAMARWLNHRAGRPHDAQRAWPSWAFMGPWIVLCCAGGYWVGMNLGDLILGRNNVAELLATEKRLLLPIAFIIVTVSVGTTWFFYARGKLATAQAQAEAAQRAAAENQLRLLQSQLEPHMLFNTLANLRVLITLDPPRAQAMLDQLVSFLRATLQASRQSAHPLSEEFARLQDYLALMQVRMGDRLQVEVNLPDALRNTPVPPLLLQPLVENSIKHGLEPQREGGRITLTAQRLGDQLVMTVRDTGIGLAPTPSSAGTGFGLEQVRARLATLHGARAHAELLPAPDAEGGTVARITLPLAL